MSQETLQVIPGNPREILRIPGHSVCKGVFAGPSGPSREAPGVGCKTVLDKKQITREKNKEKEEKKTAGVNDASSFFLIFFSFLLVTPS